MTDRVATRGPPPSLTTPTRTDTLRTFPVMIHRGSKRYKADNSKQWGACDSVAANSSGDSSDSDRDGGANAAIPYAVVNRLFTSLFHHGYGKWDLITQDAKVKEGLQPQVGASCTTLTRIDVEDARSPVRRCCATVGQRACLHMLLRRGVLVGPTAVSAPGGTLSPSSWRAAGARPDSAPRASRGLCITRDGRWGRGGRWGRDR